MIDQTDRQMKSDLFLPRIELDELIRVLLSNEYQVIGPTIEQEAIVYASIQSAEELPQGWTDLQEPAVYRIERREDDAYFGYNVGPRSWKQFLFPPHLNVSTANRTENGAWEFKSTKEDPPLQAFLGVRACELEAIKIQDRIFLEGDYVEPDYQRRRAQVLIIAVNCTQAAPTCFCTSMDTGPECHAGYDLALTEITEGFLVSAGTDRGRELLQQLNTRDPSENELESAQSAKQHAVDQISKQMDTDGLRELLLSNLEHNHWDEVATRCLSCTNCTMVCPTCFCSTVGEVSDLAGENVERNRQWDSCFNVDFSYMNGGVVRNNIKNRYRQWLTHKLATWEDQFDTSGCVGCGRCITWCPVGIDLTEEVAAIRKESDD